MHYNLNQIVSREGTQSVKYDFRQEYFGRNDLLPMWVADMDFPAPQAVTEKLIERAKHPIYGYTLFSDSYYQSIIKWQKERHGWDIKKEHILFSPGIVTAINMVVQAFTGEGDGVIVQPPVYFPFIWAVKKNKRKIHFNELIREGERYFIDFSDLEEKMQKGAKLLLFCSPHNPVGRVWADEELSRLADLCIKYDVLVLSDEIHGDLALGENKHIPLAKISDDIAARTITCFAPSKTFNLAGLATSSVVISDEKLRENFKAYEDKIHLRNNLFGSIASEAAYSNGKEWLETVLEYIGLNAEFVSRFFKENLPEIRVTITEATYLMWLDFSGLGLDADEVKSSLIEKAGVGLNDGRIFGPGGDGFFRMNIACSHSVIESALVKIAETFKK